MSTAIENLALESGHDRYAINEALRYIRREAPGVIGSEVAFLWKCIEIAAQTRLRLIDATKMAVGAFKAGAL